MNSVSFKPNVRVAFGDRIKIKEVNEETPLTSKVASSVGTSFTTQGSSGSGSGTVVGPLIKFVAIFSPGLAAWMAGNLSSAGTTTTLAAGTTANKSATKVVKVVVEKDKPLDPS